MKKLALLILGIILGAGAMYFYFHNDENTDDMTEVPSPSGLIKPSEIKTLTEAYNARYDTITNQFFRGIEGGDNRSSWYSIEDLENYLTLAKQQANDLGYTMNGVRLYLGAHPTIDNVPGYTTLLFVPTGYVNTSEGNMLNPPFQKGGNNDIPGGNGLNKGGVGDPPSANYPQ